MNILRTFRVFFAYDLAVKWIFIEACIELARARFAVARPFSKLAPTLGLPMQETSTHVSLQDIPRQRKVSHVISIVSRYTFWESKCLVRAIAAMRMLERRRMESTLYLGTAKDENGELIAHAWLRSGSLYITGAEEMRRFTIVQKFAKTINE